MSPRKRGQRVSRNDSGEDGTMLRINYDAHNGYPYTAIGRILIERGLVPREEMSMDRIRQWMSIPIDTRLLQQGNFFGRDNRLLQRVYLGSQSLNLRLGARLLLPEPLVVSRLFTGETRRMFSDVSDQAARLSLDLLFQLALTPIKFDDVERSQTLQLLAQFAKFSTQLILLGDHFVVARQK